MNTLKKWIKPVVVWLLIPLFLDLINLFLLGGHLPKLWLMFDFYLTAILYSTLAWFIYATIVTEVLKQKSV